MRVPLIIALLVFSLAACKKTKSDAPITLADSTYQITLVERKEIDEYLVAYKIAPPLNQTIDEAALEVSETNNFTDSTVSVSLQKNINTNINKSVGINSLKASTTYYLRLVLSFNKQKYFSKTSKFTTDPFQITSVDYRALPAYLNKKSEKTLTTNLIIQQQSQIKSKVFLNNYQCTVTQDFGGVIKFNLPASIPEGRYKVILERNKLKAETIDSVFVTKGEWAALSNFPAATSNYGPNTLMNFGTCYSGAKGYMVGGRNFAYTLDATGHVYDREDYVLEFTPGTNQWNKIVATNPTYFHDPITYYYNNSIYVIGGFQAPKVGDPYALTDMYRFDLGTKTWIKMAPLGYPRRANEFSFEFNGEWYIGFGNNQLPNPGPRNDFYKYNPATDTWTHLADFPGTYYLYSAPFVIGSKAYLFAGEAGYNGEKELWEYEPTLDSWKKLNLNIAVPHGQNFSVVSLHGKAYFLTSEDRICSPSGCFYIVNTTHFYEFDPVTNQFSIIATPSANLNTYKVLYQSSDKVILVDNLRFSQVVSTSAYEFKAD